MIRYLLMLCLAILSCSAAAAEAQEHTKDSPAVVKANLKNEKALLLDVREKKEWEAGHLAEAKWMPLSKLQKGIAPTDLVEDLKKEKIIYTHCRSGRRSVTAAKILEKLGYDVRALRQGFEDLSKAGFEVVEKE